VRTERIVFSVLLVGNAVAIVGILVTQGWQHAISPALITVSCGFVLIGLLKHPPTPNPWTRGRVVLSAAVLVPVTLVTFGLFAWLAIVAADRSVRIAAAGGVAFVIAVPVWFVRKAQREHREVPPAESD
jgi:drug/metabolite transporter superfamily protein YnfA